MTKDNTHLPLRHKTFSRGTTKTSLHGAITKKGCPTHLLNNPYLLFLGNCISRAIFRPSKLRKPQHTWRM